MIFFYFAALLCRKIEQDKENPDLRQMEDAGDGIMDMLLKPTLTTYDSKCEDKKGSDDEDDE